MKNQSRDRPVRHVLRPGARKTALGRASLLAAALNAMLGRVEAAALVAAHGGTITVDTHLGCGATFAVRLPLADRATPQLRAESQPAMSPWLAARREVG
jgi:hypothetical protein